MTPDADVAIVGAGPVGLLLANLLGARGHRVVVLEQSSALIDYPRGVGMDDECLRAFQAAGLVDRVLPHTSPDHWMYFLTGSGRRFLTIEPRVDAFGWPRRNAFIQPLIDAVLAAGLERFGQVSLRFDAACTGFAQDDHGVTIELAGGGAVRARYLIGCDGGRSMVRKGLGIAFEGKTERDRWLVIDIADDPIGTPGVYFHCVTPRPHVSIALPHGIRRLEFLLFDDEAPDDAISDDLRDDMLRTMVADPGAIAIIRSRVYTHHGRLAARFRERRVLIAGDAAHIMPVWQGQGYNSGIRDAFNLGWKLALVLEGVAGDRLLDSYESERRDHARAMIALSQTAGRILSPTNRFVVAMRDALTYLLGAIPAVKRYFVEMRFKPLPRYREGAMVHGAGGYRAASPVGSMFIQPRIVLPGGAQPLLDDVIGAGFALIAWGTDPAAPLSPAAREIVDRLGTTLIAVLPLTQLAHDAARYPGVTVVGDRDGRLKAWFDTHPESVILLRPDRIVALACRPDTLDAQIVALGAVMALNAAVPTIVADAA